jgi:hypothetical protein
MENTDEPKGITSITSYALQEQVSDTGQDYARCWNQNKVSEVDEEVAALIAK